MRFGIGPFSAEAFGNVGWTEAYEIMGQAARVAEESGFDSTWVAERNFTEDGYCPAAFVAAANIAAQTEALKIGVMPILGLTHPLYVAEDAVVLDILSSGRAIVVPINAVAHEMAAHAIPESRYDSRFSESVRVLIEAWSARPFSFAGEHWTIPAQLDGHVENRSGTVTMTPKPAQIELPLWIGGFWDHGRRLAAELGLPMVLGAISDDSLLGDLWGEYDRDVRASARRPLRVLIRDVYVSNRDDPASECATMLSRQFERYDSWGLWSGDASDFEELTRGRFIIGNPDQVIEQIRSIDDRFGLDKLICRMHFPGMPLHQLLRSVRLFSSEVIPEFRMPDLPHQIRQGV